MAAQAPRQLQPLGQEFQFLGDVAGLGQPIVPEPPARVYVPVIPQHTLYVFEGFSRVDIEECVLFLMRGIRDNEEVEDKDIITVLMSCLEGLVPGVSAHYETRLTNFNRVVIPLAVYESIVEEGVIPERYLNNPDIAIFSALINPTDVGIPVNLALCIFSIATFAVGKQATATNYAAFRTNRMRAFFARLDEPQPENEVIDEFFPTHVLLRRINRAFNMYGAYRQAFVTPIIGWIGRTISRDTDQISSVTKLWANQGMSHVIIIRYIIVTYAPVLVRLIDLRGEIELFLNDYRRSVTLNPHFTPFTKVVAGDTDQFMPARNYQDLLRLAKSILSEKDPRFDQYAPGLEPSPYYERFRGLCNELGLIAGTGAQGARRELQ